MRLLTISGSRKVRPYSFTRFRAYPSRLKNALFSRPTPAYWDRLLLRGYRTELPGLDEKCNETVAINLFESTESLGRS